MPGDLAATWGHAKLHGLCPGDIKAWAAAEDHV